MAGNIRIKNLVKQQSLLCAEMFQSVRQGQSFYKSLQPKIQELVDTVDGICSAHQSTPRELPKPSRDAYSWLVFLNNRHNLRQHQQTLKRLFRLSKTAKKRSSKYAQTEIVTLELVNCAALYRARFSPTGASLQFSEGLIAATDDVLQAVTEAIYLKKTPTRTKQIRQFSLSEPFIDIVMELDLIVQVAAESAQGGHYDLDKLYDQIQREYFEPTFEKPRIMWSSICATRKLGHYESARDRVVLSPILDNPAIPEYAVAFVLYHELLHKLHGVEWQQNRLMAHTPEFRRSEKKFRYYQEAMAVLRNLPVHPL